MESVRLTPLPTLRAIEDSGALKMERDGFVDEQVVLALVNRPLHVRHSPDPADLALAADDLDFAGWRLPTRSPVRRPEIPPQVISAIVRRASPPTLVEAENSLNRSSNHRWWMAGLFGILATMLLSILILTLLSRPHHPSELQAPPTPISQSGPVSPQAPDSFMTMTLAPSRSFGHPN